MSPEGEIIDPSFEPGSDELAIQMYKNMVAVSVMDLIMFDAQRQGRISFYMTSHGEEGTCVGSASALEPEDVIFSQYREAGVFMQRGFTYDNFMSQLFANNKDNGKGRNMPVHYGSAELNIVSTCFIALVIILIEQTSAHNIVAFSYPDPTGSWCCLRPQNATINRPEYTPEGSGMLFW